jgi:hypothetical protein
VLFATTEHAIAERMLTKAAPPKSPPLVAKQAAYPNAIAANIKQHPAKAKNLLTVILFLLYHIQNLLL